MDQVQVSLDKFKEQLDQQPLLQKLEDQTGVNKLYLVGGGSAVVVFMIVAGIGAGVISNLVGFAYPAYASFKAVESEDKADDVQWLTYWIVYSFFVIFEVFIDTLLYCIPSYYAFKLGFMAWLFMPSTRGATFIYKQVLEPFLSKHESRIDGALKSAVENSADIIADASAIAASIGKEAARAAANHAIDSK